MAEIQKHKSLFDEICTIIEQGKQKVTAQVNSILTLTYWHIGKRINEDVLQNQRAEYGKQIVATLSTQLAQEYGRSFEARNLRRMMQFAELFPDYQIVSPLATQLSWTHFIILLSIKKEDARLFYAYSFTINSTIIKRQKIMLPINDNHEQDYDYMENYIKQLELNKLKKYLEYKK
jgi:hypothetical protein